MSAENKNQSMISGPPILNFKEGVAPYEVFPGLPDTVKTPEQAQKFLEFLAEERSKHAEAQILIEKNSTNQFTLILQLKDDFVTDIFSNVINERLLTPSESKHYLGYLLSIQLITRRELGMIGDTFKRIDIGNEVPLIESANIFYLIQESEGSGDTESRYSNKDEEVTEYYDHQIEGVETNDGSNYKTAEIKVFKVGKKAKSSMQKRELGKKYRGFMAKQEIKNLTDKLRPRLGFEGNEVILSVILEEETPETNEAMERLTSEFNSYLS